MGVVEKAREAVKKKNNESDDKEKKPFHLSGLEEEKMREFEARAKDMDDIMGRMEEAGVDTKELTAEIKNLVRDIS